MDYRASQRNETKKLEYVQVAESWNVRWNGPAEDDGVWDSSASTSAGEIDTDSDFPCNLFLRCSNASSSVVFPTSPFRTGASVLLLARAARGATGVTLGVPGEVGGRESGAELMECAPRLWPYTDGFEGPASAFRVFVNVIVTENGSPAKYADWDGVIATRMPASASEDDITFAMRVAFSAV